MQMSLKGRNSRKLMEACHHLMRFDTNKSSFLQLHNKNQTKDSYKATEGQSSTFKPNHSHRDNHKTSYKSPWSMNHSIYNRSLRTTHLKAKNQNKPATYWSSNSPMAKY